MPGSPAGGREREADHPARVLRTKGRKGESVTAAGGVLRPVSRGEDLCASFFTLAVLKAGQRHSRGGQDPRDATLCYLFKELLGCVLRGGTLRHV